MSAINERIILVPVDLGPLSNAALGRAVALARPFGASLVLLHVMKASTPQMVLPPGVPVAVRPEIPSSEDRRSRLRALGKRHQASGTPLRDRIEITTEPISASILRVAREEKADIIVMSTHGRTGLKRVVLGSVAEEVVRDATVPVLLVPEGAVAEEQEHPAERPQELGV